MKGPVVYVYLMCFAFNRYQKIHDNLVSSFIHYVNKYVDEAKEAVQEEIYNLKIESNENLEKVAKVLDFFVDEEISDEQSFGEVRQKAFEILRKEKFSALSKYMAGIRFDEAEYEWNYYEKKGATFKKNLRPLFLAIDFESHRKDDPLIAAVAILKEILRDKRRTTQIRDYVYPQTIISAKLKKYLYDAREIEVEGKRWQIQELNVNKFEFLIYRLLNNSLESYDIVIKDSILFKSFEEDLVDDEKWKNRDQLIQNLELPYLDKPVDEILDSLEKELETKITQANDRIQKGQNPHIKITKRKGDIRWNLPYPSHEDPENHPLYDQLPQIEIYDLLAFVAEKSKLMEAFEHILETYVKKEMDDQAIIACIIALATNMGIRKMAQISDIGYQALFGASNNFIRLETLKKGNDQISNAIAQLPIFKYYNVEEEVIHASSDGQKFETQIDILRSRYSPKYFGLDKGIVPYTLLANHVPINAKMIGANDHESHFLFDVIYNNTSDIRPDRVSTDTHGRNNVNSAILHIFGYLFAPRLKTLNQDSKLVYAFQNPQAYQDCLIKPIRKINRALIKEEWENIQRIIVSLALKETTQCIIIRKLSSTKRKNKTQKALWEFDNIISSLYFLNYIDNVLLRQHVQKAVNRVESYHKLKRAIFHDNFGRFRVKTEVEQEIWSECTRLIANSVIFYNSYFLSKILEERKKAGTMEDADIFKKISPVAWKHINFYGRFEFQKENKHSTENIEKILGAGTSFLFL
jgi:TnpA family transposase